ncbi:Reverse transcriptase domain-containing protein [Aphis craccivora]|uniref:Reverse transcriptase domain-containing protein n=1 Tax=Aphis craccivora TaxID=307492 RepID=A0A6G0XGK8_APHCR|nr:Reverse transcriptase domain-containing protein [Aphis craccivora]
MLETIDADPWGKLYKLVTRKLQGPPATTNMDAQAVLRITDTLFPTRPLVDTQILPVDVEFPPFSAEEVDKAVYRAQKITAPGMDGITGRILSAVYRFRPTMLTGLYNSVRQGWYCTS